MMAETVFHPARFQRVFLIGLLIAISLIFFFMVRGMIMAVLIAAIFAGLVFPIYRRFRDWLGGRRTPAAIVTVVLFVFALLIPLTAFLGIVGGQALQVSDSVGPWIERELSRPDELDRILASMPFAEELAPYKDLIATKLGEVAARVGNFVVGHLATATRGTVVFLLMLFIMLYAMFFFLRDGRRILEKIVYYMPLPTEHEERIIARFVSVTRATLKGTLVIGVVQGTLGGLAFAVVGIPGAAFWGTVMAVVSIIPALGTGLIWVPAAIYLAAIGQMGAAIGLTVWCATAVGLVDNLLRPWLVGRDTEMPDLLILLSTLGGIGMFGALGIVIGPIVGALFLTIWEIYGDVFQDILPSAPLFETPSPQPRTAPSPEG